MRYTPNARWHFKHPEYSVEYAINGQGFRDAEHHPVPKPDGELRVLLLGDSFTFGQAVNYEQTWPVIAEKLLSRSGKNHISLVKAGIQGMDTRSEFILMRRLIEDCECDAVVVGFLINDRYTNTLHGIKRHNEIIASVEGNGKIHDDGNQTAKNWSATSMHTFVRANFASDFHLLNLAKLPWFNKGDQSS